MRPPPSSASEGMDAVLSVTVRAFLFGASVF